MPTSDGFFDQYFQFVRGTESPIIFHRWSAIGILSALLKRSFWLQHGHARIFPNHYIMLVGDPGTRKSTSIKIAKKLLVSSGYDRISAERTTKEKFLMDLARMHDTEEDGGADAGYKVLDEQLFGPSEFAISEMLIAADEANEFFGINNMDFLSMLGSLWDFDDPKPYQSRIKNGKSVDVPNPSISILAGNTPKGFSLAFPDDLIGQGFFSRLLLIYSEGSGRRITWPRIPSTDETSNMVSMLRKIAIEVQGPATVTPEAMELIDGIYKGMDNNGDARFDGYYNRRFTHHIKLCLVMAASRCSTVVDADCVIQSNTLLTYAESFMPKALGEFGRSKHSDVSHKIMSKLLSTDDIVSVKELWQLVINDMEKWSDLGELLRKLQAADKIMYVDNKRGVQGFIAKRTSLDQTESEFVDWSYLTQEEKDKQI